MRTNTVVKKYETTFQDLILNNYRSPPNEQS